MNREKSSVKLLVDYNGKSKRWGWSVSTDALVKQGGKALIKLDSVVSGYTYASQTKALSEAVTYCLKDSIHDFRVIVKRAETRGRKNKPQDLDTSACVYNTKPSGVLKTKDSEVV